MKVIRKISELRQAVRSFRVDKPQAAIGFVPTMGYLHEGHASLFTRARQECELVVVSIFVNPLQFGPNEDFETYPRDEARDLQLAEQKGVDIVFLPDASEMYPTKPLTTVSVTQLTASLCGASRPGHFDGVCTVVSKLFNIVQPDRAYFGLKDAQQVAVIQQMTEDLNMPVEIVPCPIIRESDGLALSSRNVYLSEEERRQAVILPRSLQAADEYMKTHPEGTVGELRELITDKIGEAPLAKIEYVELVHFPSLDAIQEDTRITDAVKQAGLLAALAVRFGKTRLIDNQLWIGKEASR